MAIPDAVAPLTGELPGHRRGGAPEVGPRDDC